MEAIIKFLNDNSGALTVIFTFFVTLSTVIYAILTKMLVSETKKLREVQTEPKIEVTLRPIDFALNFMRLHVKNIGLGPAIDVRFQLEINDGGVIAQEVISEFTESKFLLNGLSYFGPNQEVYSNYTRLNVNFKEKMKCILVVTALYKSILGKNYEDKYLIIFSEKEGEYRLGEPDMHSIAIGIKKIESTIEKIASGYNRIRADIYTNEDRIREKTEREEKINERILKSKSS